MDKRDLAEDESLLDMLVPEKSTGMGRSFNGIIPKIRYQILMNGLGNSILIGSGMGHIPYLKTRLQKRTPDRNFLESVFIFLVIYRVALPPTKVVSTTWTSLLREPT